ncbi:MULTISPECIES: hypothetical protein [Epilithonimonas]|uniref:DUF304 domain-containing protein n=1 Tax=Epilithonimonas hispanica TaxID=358687 RepID=A0A3D9CTW1_9FLAO|nr:MULTISPECIES: hypothetical protein [Epilithonimonas]REC69210.1 hypothetical protein DRF58_12750 [Epilithonimonas hispanica]
MFYTQSKFIDLIFNLRFQDLLCPWKLIVDSQKKTITSEKRNWFLIGINKTTIPISNIRNITINEHIFGADIHIKIYGSSISTYFLPKKDVAEIRKILNF